MKNMKKINQKQKGFTLIEMMAVIAVGSLLIYIGMKSYPLARDYMRQMDLSKQITTFSTVVEQSCVNGDCSNISTERVVASGNLREYHDANGTSVLSITGVAVEFAPANIGAGTNNGLSQIHENITQRVCNMTVKTVWDQAAIINVDGVAVKSGPDAVLDEDLINANCTVGMNQVEVITAAS